MILCFSGTGNTLDVARRLAQALGDRNLVRLEGECLLHPENFDADTPQTPDIVWAFPVYSWGVPPVVANFIRNVADTMVFRAAKHWMLCTCGDDTGMTDRQWRRLIDSRGWISADAFSVTMPNTYTLMKGFDTDSPDIAAAKLRAMPAAVRSIAARIRLGDAVPLPPLVRGAWPHFKSGIIRPWFERFAMSPKPFRTTGGCTSCGLCARSCPMKNISMTAGSDGAPALPHWSGNCALCLRCYHICPRRAIAYGRHATDGKGQWINTALRQPPKPES